MSPGSINTTRTPKRHVSSRKLSLALRPRTCVTGALLAHDGQHGAADAEHAEEVGLHLLAGFGDGGVFDRSHQGPAGVVHDRIETAGFLHNGGHCAGDGVIVVCVHGEHVDAVEGVGLLAAGAEYAPTPRGQMAGDGLSDPGGSVGDQDDVNVSREVGGQIRWCAHRVIITM